MAADRRLRRERIGRGGERAACILLLLKGYRPRHRNWRGPTGELDLVVERGGLIVFVEVKTRSSELYGGALAAFDRDKRLAVVRTAAAYLGRYSLWDRPCRFDLVAIERLEHFPWWRPRHVVDAFTPDFGRLLG